MRTARLALSLVLAAGCGPREPAGSAEAAAGSSGAGGAGAETPATDRDPPPWVPPPSESGQTGAATGIVVSSADEQSRVVALRVVRAIHDLDSATLTLLVDDPVVSLGGGAVPREAAIRAWLELIQQSNVEGLALEELFELHRITVSPLSERYRGGVVPAGFRATDVIVSIPLSVTGRQRVRLGGFQMQLVVRPGAEPRVIGR